MAKKKNDNEIIASYATAPPQKSPVDIKNEAAVVAEFRRLKKKINKLYNELQLSRHSVNVFKTLFFEAPEFEEVRNLVLSFADEYAVIKNEIEDAKRFKKFERDDAKKRTKEVIDKFTTVSGDIETARRIFSDCFDSQKHKLEEYTYCSVEEDLITKLKLSPEAAAIIKDFDEYEKKNNRKHTRSEYRHKFPNDWNIEDAGGNEDYDETDGQCAETLPDNRTMPITLIIKEARLECEKITLKFHEKHLAEVKITLENTLPKKQAKRYYQYHYENMRVVDISNAEGGTRAASISESLEAASKNIMIFNIKLSPSKELYDNFWSEINPWKDKIMFYNGGLR